ncbi:MAG: UDP-N-acetylmuramoyl-tripeptide--D-alanyl-D-alanine ligase [Clostridioides sp.]|jgi:UDP-N-acetylmuramoyl-tripeptide--D-alanyl-D-alanine ligase|nr:UDP-N-acetylmuramoyl-tripeptide--D-alanyl-D-alanine ligase [Clostridioides sp.]
MLTFEELIVASEGEKIKGDYSYSIENIVIDSRIANEKKAFVAIVGENQDGHKYIDSAIKNGCKTIIKNKVNEEKFDSEGINIIEVDDTTIALGNIARYYRDKFNINFVAVTGSVGKTTTRDMIYSALSSEANVLKNQKNLNNHWGVPLTIFNLNSDYDYAVIEMGMSGFGEIEYLSDIVKPQIAVISNIGTSHIEKLGSKEGIFKAKMEIASKFTKENTLIVNGDDEYLKKLKNQDLPYKLLTFGFESDNTIYCKDYILNEKNTVFTCIYKGEEYEVFIPIMGKHNIYNAMASILVGFTLGVDFESIKQGLANLSMTKMRLDVIQKKKYTIINDCYNASVDSMEASLEVLGNYKQRRVAILGDMLEMGEFAKNAHKKVGAKAVQNSDVLIAIGKDARYIADEFQKETKDIATDNAIKNVNNSETEEINLNEKNEINIKNNTNIKDIKNNTNIKTEKEVFYFENNKDAIQQLKNILQQGDVILVKASRGMHLEEIVDAI